MSKTRVRNNKFHQPNPEKCITYNVKLSALETKQFSERRQKLDKQVKTIYLQVIMMNSEIWKIKRRA